MKFGSVCSGIEAASVAWHGLGWSASWLSEIEPFPCAVLAHHYPHVPNLGDMTKIAARVLTEQVEAPEVFCGGTPCQAFSVAGLRQSLNDERGNLSLKFIELANAIDFIRAKRGEDPSIVFWENVPGVLSTKDNAFGCFLAGLAGEDEPLEPPGGKWANAGAVYGPQRAVAWRTLDAQYFGVAQRRRRVFVVASARNGFDPATVLFEWDGLRRDTAPSREARQVAPTIPSRSTAGGGLRTDFDLDGGVITTHTLRGEGFDASEDGTGRGTPLVPVSYGIRTANTSSNGWGIQEEVTHTLDCAQGLAVAQPIAFPANLSGTQCASAENLAPAMTAKNPTAVAHVDVAPTMRAGGNQTGGDRPPGTDVDTADSLLTTPTMQVRRLTPVECERLQGFPDGYTQIPWRKKPASECPDGPRYKALGNSWAVPVVTWLGRRIDAHAKRARRAA